MPVEYSGITAEHLAVRTRAGAVRRQPHGRDRDRRQGRARHGAAPDVQRRQPPEGGAGPVLGPAHAGRHVRGRHPRLPHGAQPLHAGGQRRQHRQGLHVDRRAGQDGGRGGGRRFERALRAARGAGAGRARYGAAAHGGRPRRRCGRTGSPTARWRRRGRSSRAPATPARTASRSTCRPTWPTACGRPCCRPGTAAGVVPCGLGARDTLRLEAAMRLYGQDIDDTHDAARSRSRGRSSAGTSRRSSAPSACARRRPPAPERTLVGLEITDRGHRPSRLRGAQGRRRGGDGDERHADAVSQEGHRDGLSAAGAGGPRHHTSTWTSAGAPPRPVVAALPFYKRARQSLTRCPIRAI